MCKDHYNDSSFTWSIHTKIVTTAGQSSHEGNINKATSSSQTELHYAAQVTTIVVSENSIAAKPHYQAYFKMHLHSMAKPYHSKKDKLDCYAHSPQYLSLS